MAKVSAGRVAMFDYQDPAVLVQANPTQNEWYTILEASDYVIIWDVAVNIEDTDETLEVRFIVDEITMPPFGRACTHSTSWLAYRYPDAIARTGEIGLVAIARAEYKGGETIQGHNVKVQVRKTTNAGVGNLTGVCMWGQLRDVP